MNCLTALFSLGSATAGGTGTWTIITDLAEGSHSINAKQTDPTGNVSVASASLPVTIDISVSAPSIPVLDTSDDNGLSPSDYITSKTTDLTFSGTSENNAAIQLYDGTTPLGSTTATPTGSWSIDLSLTAGTYSIHAVQTDLAGNVSSASGNQPLTIDTTAPSAPSDPDLDDADDIGSSPTDNITKNTSDLTLSGTAENNARIELFDGATSLGTITADSFGAWHINLALAAGTYAITATQTDTAGNTSPASGILPLVIDTAASAPSVPDLTSDDDTGSSPSDNITSKTTELTFTGTAEIGASVEIFNGVSSLGTATANESGAWT